jgi:hypothetical protein
MHWDFWWESINKWARGKDNITSKKFSKFWKMLEIIEYFEVKRQTDG